MKAYEKWIIQQGTKAAYLNKRSIRSVIIDLLYKEVKYNQNQQAFEILEQAGDKYFTDATFENAADILLAKRE
jgi:hypothetical protein|tara:strand:+ start:3806 stop:4024 length:219 start_codon:yes stop_codon:yes gene_type:complete